MKRCLHEAISDHAPRAIYIPQLYGLASTAEYGSMTQNAAGSQEMTYTYGWKCICKSEMEMHISKLTYIPECLLCGELMFMMYSIDKNGGIWMNKALLIEQEYN